MRSVALIAGFLMAFFGSMPPTAPIAVLVLQRGVLRKYRAGLAIAIGAALAESAYAAAAVFGLSALFERFPGLEWIFRTVGVLILFVLGVHFMRFKPAETSESQPEKVRSEVSRLGAPFLLGF